MLLTSNYNIELTAAILRDKSETVREHYAHLLPKDVRQPNNALKPKRNRRSKRKRLESAHLRR